jgi:hypothetical protein
MENLLKSTVQDMSRLLRDQDARRERWERNQDDMRARSRRWEAFEESREEHRRLVKKAGAGGKTHF